MAGLLGDILGDNKAKQADWQQQVNAYGSGLKSKFMGLLQDPAGSLNQFVSHLGEQVDRNSDLMNQAGWMPIAKTNATKEQQAMARALLAEQGSQMGIAGVVGYHGTMNPSFEKFNLDNFGKTDQGWLGKGVYAAKSPTDASAYAMVDGKPGGAVFKVDMDLKNPLNIDWEAANRAEMLSKRQELGPEGFTAWLQKQGHDGVIFQGPKNALNSAGERDIQYMAIDPEIVKQIGY